jgi:hypothetical protein
MQAREYELKRHTDLDEFIRLHYQHPSTLAEQIISCHKAFKENPTTDGAKKNRVHGIM